MLGYSESTLNLKRSLQWPHKFLLNENFERYVTCNIDNVTFTQQFQNKKSL